MYCVLESEEAAEEEGVDVEEEMDEGKEENPSDNDPSGQVRPLGLFRNCVINLEIITKEYTKDCDTF